MTLSLRCKRCGRNFPVDDDTVSPGTAGNRIIKCPHCFNSVASVGSTGKLEPLEPDPEPVADPVHEVSFSPDLDMNKTSYINKGLGIAMEATDEALELKTETADVLIDHRKGTVAVSFHGKAVEMVQLPGHSNLLTLRGISGIKG